MVIWSQTNTHTAGFPLAVIASQTQDKAFPVLNELAGGIQPQTHIQTDIRSAHPRTNFATNGVVPEFHENQVTIARPSAITR